MARTVKPNKDGVITSCPKDVKEAVIPAGVTEIGGSAFSYCTALASVVIPDSVTEIGKGAFSGCESLASVVIPDSVTRIGDSAFKGCNITELSHPCLTIKGGVAIKDGKVQYCASQAREIVIPAGVTEIGKEAFSYCKALASVVIPDSVTKIGDDAFEDCTSLASVVIPESVTEIGKGAFYGCTSLASVEIPAGVTEIGGFAFCGCAALASVVIPESVTRIGSWAFEDCAALASVVIPAGVTEIVERAFSGCKALAAVEFGGTMAQWDAVKGKKYLFNGNVPATGVKCADGVWQKPVVQVEDGVAVKCLDKSASSVEIPAGVTKIGDWAFSGCKALVSVVIPDSVTEIGGYAFSGCKALASVVIPESVTSIDGFAFCGCESLSSVVIPAGVTKIGDDAFSGCKALASVVIGAGVTAIGLEAFKGCTSLKTVTLADNLAKVNADWFKDLPEDCEIVCTEGSAAYKAVKRSSKLKAHVKALALETAKTEKIRQIQQVSADAFIGSLLKDKADSSFEILASTKAGTVVLVQIAENNAVFKLGADSSKWTDKAKKAAEILSDSAKSGREIYDALLKNKLPLAEIPAKKAENLTLKAGADKTVRLFCKGEVKAYGRGYTWHGWTWHSIFPEDVRSAELFGVTAIVAEAFRDCTALASVVIPESVTEIGESAFSGCTSLSSVVIPEGVTKISGSFFKGAFSGCKALASVVIPESVTAIDEYTFYGCKALASVEFGGTVAQWEAVKKGEDWHKDVPAKSVKCADGEARL